MYKMNFFKRRNKINFIILGLFFIFFINNIFSINAYIKDENDDDLSLLISTLDGSIYSFNYQTGELNWDVNPNDESLYSTSQFSNIAKSSTTTKSSSLLIPTLDGTGLLFQYSSNGNSLQKVPFSLQDLVNSSPLFLKELTTDTDNDDIDGDGDKDTTTTMFIGNKKTSITVVDSKTGDIIKSMSKDGLWIDEMDCPSNIPDDALMFTRSDYQVIALDPKSGLEKWNLSIGEYIPHSTKSFYNSESLLFEGSIEVAPISQNKFRLYIKKQEKTVVGILHNYWKCELSSSPVSIYAYSSSKHILKKLDFIRATKSNTDSPFLPTNTINDQLVVPNKFDQQYIFQDYNGQFFVVNPSLPPQQPPPSTTPLITDNSNNNNNKNSQIIDSNNNNKQNNNNQNNSNNTLKNNDIYLYSSIIILFTSIIVFIRSKKNFNLINLTNNSGNNNNQKNNNNNKKTPKKKKKKNKNKIIEEQEQEEEEDEENENNNDLINEFISDNNNSNSIMSSLQPITIPLAATTTTTTKITNGKIILENGNVKIGKLEIITNKILGTGSCGTIVYEGKMEGRKVAVKRMLSQFVKFADREVSILIHSDEHTNVVRYFAKEEDGEFIYLAISFCQKSLDMYVQQTIPPRPSPSDLSPSLPSSKITATTTASTTTTTTTTTTTKTSTASTTNNSNQQQPILIDSKTKQMIFELFKGLEHLHSLNIVHRDIKPHNILIDPNNRVKISDMGLGKLLDSDDASLTFTSDSHGWQPAEYLNGTNRNTKKVDIFSIGCVVYYLLTGVHPFGARYNREKNVLKGKFDIELIQHLPDIHHLVQSMIQYEPEKRPDITECINHPFFWEVHKKLSFLVAASDYLEFEKPTSPLNLEIDSHIDLVTGGDGDWWLKIDKVLIDNIGRYRKYNGKSIRDLLRVIRNKFNHYRDLSPEEQTCLGPLPEGFFNYFDSKFSQLFTTTYLFICKNLKNDQYFVQYF